MPKGKGIVFIVCIYIEFIMILEDFFFAHEYETIF